MSRQSSDLSKHKPEATTSERPSIAPLDLGKIQRSPWRRPLLVMLLLLIGAGVIVLSVAMLFLSPHPDTQSTSKWAGFSPEEIQLAERFMALKNADDPRAEECLAPPPPAPAEPVSESEANRIQTECFLHQDIRILSVHPNVEKRLVLVTKGNVSAPTLEVRSASGISRIQRTMANPDLIVEVREGKIRGVRAEMHSD